MRAASLALSTAALSCLALACLGLVACSEQAFHNTQGESEGGEPQPEEHDDGGGPDVGFTPDTGDSGWWPEEDEEQGPAVHEPQACSLDTMVWMGGSGPQDCPEHYAAYMMDDGDGPNFVCCALPATDILVPGTTVDAGAACGANQVITGFLSAYSYRCTDVDDRRYTIGTPAVPCYFGSGASGGSGVAGCADHPHTWDVLQQSVFGSDGCSGYPYGSLFVSQSGDDCDDMRAVPLLFNGQVEGDPPAGTAVEMFHD